MKFAKRLFPFESSMNRQIKFLLSILCFVFVSAAIRYPSARLHTSQYVKMPWSIQTWLMLLLCDKSEDLHFKRQQNCEEKLLLNTKSDLLK